MHKISRLTNGIRVVTEKIDYVKSVSAGVWVGAGSVYETEMNNGVSHFIEHMLFKGTKSRSAKDIAKFMDNVGGQLNAVTAKEYTCYYAKTLTEHTPMAVEILSDMVKNSTFTAENIETERKVILEEINMCEDDPEDYIHDILSRTMWRENSLGYPIAGTAETLAKIHRDAMLDYFDGRYCGKNIVISVVGNFDEEELLASLEEKFGDIKSGGERFISQNKIEIKRSAEIVHRDIEQCQLCIGFEGYPRGENMGYNLAVVNGLFGGNMSSRLFQKVREECGLAYSIYSYTSSYMKNGALTVSAGLSRSELLQALKIISDEIALLKKDKLSADEILMAKNQLKASVVMGSEGISALMSSYGKSMLFENKVKTLDDIISSIDGVTPEGVAEAIDRTFDSEKMAVAVLGKTNETRDKILDALIF